MTERLRPDTVAITLAQHARDTEPEPETYLARVVYEILEAEPGVRGHFWDLYFAELLKELHRRSQGDAMRAVLEVQRHWDQEA